MFVMMHTCSLCSLSVPGMVSENAHVVLCVCVCVMYTCHVHVECTSCGTF